MIDKVIGVVGWKNSGKTTLVEKLVREMVRRGLRVSTIKHAHHDFDIDHPGKDSCRHRAAGSHEVLVVSSNRWALIHEGRAKQEPALPELFQHLEPCDIVLVEGFKHGPHQKIEVRRAESGGALLADQDETIFAVATDESTLAGRHHYLPLNDAATVASYICRHLAI